MTLTSLTLTKMTALQHYSSKWALRIAALQLITHEDQRHAEYAELWEARSDAKQASGRFLRVLRILREKSHRVPIRIVIRLSHLVISHLVKSACQGEGLVIMSAALHNNHPMPFLAATLANEKSHFLQLGNVSLEGAEFNVQLLRQFTCRYSRV